tara:strand:+ start:638 stop:799 length:162 start_codon:yes stop_codon:yes gene_type:complete
MVLKESHLNGFRFAFYTVKRESTRIETVCFLGFSFFGVLIQFQSCDFSKNQFN